VSIAEILKRYRVTVVERTLSSWSRTRLHFSWPRGANLPHHLPGIDTSLVELADEGRKAQKAKMVVVLKKISSSPVIPDDDSEQTI
jgi:hypothetical protein